MPQVNLSDLSGPDLRRLLDATRGRGDAALSYRILQEMEARREGRGQRGLFARRRAEPHLVAVDLGDPMDREDDLPPMPRWRQPPPEPEASTAPEPDVNGEMDAGQPEPEPEPEAVAEVETGPPLTLDADPEIPPPEAASQDWDLRMPHRAPKARPAPRRGLVPGLVIGIAVGAGLGWWLSGIAREGLWPPVAPALEPAPAAAPALSVTTMPAEPEHAAEAPTDAAVVSGPAPEAVEAPGAAEAQAIEAPAPAHAEDEVASAEPPAAAAPPPAPSAARDACAAEPTPADRSICADPQLRMLQRDLRQAYARALEAHEDRELLRQRQLAWKTARDGVADPDRLVALYEERIRKLDAATAAARQQR